MVENTLDAKVGVREAAETRIEGHPRPRTEHMKAGEEGMGIGLERTDEGVGHHIRIIATIIEGTDNLVRHDGHPALTTEVSSAGDTPQPATAILWTMSLVLNRHLP